MFFSTFKKCLHFLNVQPGPCALLQNIFGSREFSTHSNTMKLTLQNMKLADLKLARNREPSQQRASCLYLTAKQFYTLRKY